MSRVTIRIPTPLRSYTGGANEVLAEGTTVGEVLNALGQKHKHLVARVLAEDGSIRPFVNVYRGNDDIRALQGLATPVAEGDVLSIIPAVAGGAL